MAFTAAASPGTAATFADVLTVPCLLEALQDNECLKEFRATSRCSRDFIDSTVQMVRFTMDISVSPQRTPSPLSRWTRCKSVTVRIQKRSWRISGPFASLAAQPFVGLAIDARRRITTLKLELDACDSEDPSSLCSEQAVTQLALLLPNLRTFSFTSTYHHGISAVQQQPDARQLLMDGLASLQFLEDLTLPSQSLLAHIGSLASGNLRHLTVNFDMLEGDGDAVFALVPSALEGLSRLHHLETLTLDRGVGIKVASHADPMGLDLCALLASLPRSLKTLHIAVAVTDHAGVVWFAVLFHEDGRAAAVHASSRCCFQGIVEDTLTVKSLASFAAALLASQRAMPWGHKLDLLSLETLSVPAGTQLAPGSSSAPELQPLHALLKRCQEVRVGALFAEPGAPAVQALDLLGCVPTYLVLRAGGYGQGRVWLVPRGRGGGNGGGSGMAAENGELAEHLVWLQEKHNGLLFEQQEISRHWTTPEEQYQQGMAAVWADTSKRVWSRHLACCERLRQQLGAQGPEHQQRQQQPVGQAAPMQVDAAPEPVPSVDEVADRVWQVMASPSTPAAPALLSGGGDSADGGRQEALTNLVLLRGPLIASLLYTPEVVGPWLKGLWKKAVAAGAGPAAELAAAAAAAAEGAGARYVPWAALSVLPECMGGFVLEFRDEAAAAVAPMVEAVAAAAAAAGGGLEGLVRVATPVFRTPRLVRMKVMCVNEVNEEEEWDVKPRVRPYVEAVERVLQELLDQRAMEGVAGSGGGGGGGRGGGTAYPPAARAHMEQLMEVAAQLCNLT